METTLTNTKANPSLTVKSLFSQDSVKKKFQELLGNKMQGFVTSVLQCVASNDLLSKAEPHSIYHAASVAATLDLPINSNLGFAYIVPYNDKKSGKCLAQFQLGYKGFIQLAQRSGTFKTISATPIYDGQIIESNPLTGFEFDFTKKGGAIIGYAAYFKLLNGFEKTLYMTTDELKAHGKNFSQTFKRGFGLWETNFDSMANKTVIKLLLSRFAPLSIEMQKAIQTDQAVIHNEEATEFTYIDNGDVIDISQEEQFNDLFELFELKKESLTTDELKDAERILKNKEIKSFPKLNILLKSK